MANWALTDYVIEGSKESLQKIYNAILHHSVQEDSADNWEGNVLNELGITWINRHIVSEEKEGDSTIVKTEGYYLSGFIQEDTVELKETLTFSAEERWGVTDFYVLLQKNIKDIKVYYCVEEDGEAIYATNDREGKYFKDRWHIDACFDGNYEWEYFTTKESALKWLSEKTNGKVKTMEDIEQFNGGYEDSDAEDENFIRVHEFAVIDTTKEEA